MLSKITGRKFRLTHILKLESQPSSKNMRRERIARILSKHRGL